MSTKQRGLVQVVEAPPAERQPLGSDISVVFRGDGEPRSTEAVLKHLADFDADVGFEADSFSLGGTVERLEHRFAEMLGKEASAFMPTGTLANHLAIRRHCGESPRAVVQEQSHLYNDTGDSLAQLSSINLVPLAKGRPYFNLEELEEIVGRSDTGRVANPVGVVMIESPVRRQAGRIVPYEEMVAITDYCRERGIATHLDGARLFMMSAATGISPHKYADLFDTVYVSLYKYFVAPFGAILAGPDAFINDLYHDRRMFGGGLASSSLVAGVALKATEGFEDRFAAAMDQASALFARVNQLDGINIGRFEHGSNIFPVELGPGVDTERFLSALLQHWVFVYRDEFDPNRTLLHVNTTILRQTNDALQAAFEDALAKSSGPVS